MSNGDLPSRFDSLAEEIDEGEAPVEIKSEEDTVESLRAELARVNGDLIRCENALTDLVGICATVLETTDKMGVVDRDGDAGRDADDALEALRSCVKGIVGA